jgi:transcriptional regulator with XRE-family HTH domain
MITVITFLDFYMNRQELSRLKELLQNLRGERSIREFASANGFSNSAWRVWEAMGSIPNSESLKKIARLKGWTLEQLVAYLRTGDETSLPYSIEDLLEYARKLPLEERVELARRILEQS